MLLHSLRRHYGSTAVQLSTFCLYIQILQYHTDTFQGLYRLPWHFIAEVLKDSRFGVFLSSCSTCSNALLQDIAEPPFGGECYPRACTGYIPGVERGSWNSSSGDNCARHVNYSFAQHNVCTTSEKILGNIASSRVYEEGGCFI